MQDSPAYTAVFGLLAIVKGAEWAGVDRSALLCAAGVSEDELSDPDRLAPEATEHALWRALLDLTDDDPTIGLRVAGTFPKGTYRVLEYLIRSSRTLGEGMQTLAQHSRLLRTYSFWKFDHAPDGSSGVLSNQREYDLEDRAQRAQAEAGVATLIATARSITDEAWTPIKVTFRHRRLAQPEDYAFLAPTVEFETGDTSVHFDRTALEAHMSEADPVLHELLLGLARSALERMPRATPTAALVRDALLQRLPQADASLEAIAEQIEIGPRVLQRRLQTEGTTFRELVDRAREVLAKKFLAEAKLTAVDVALLLDYSDAAAFHRAFKRWTGMAPGAYRRSIAAGSGVDT